MRASAVGDRLSASPMPRVATEAATGRRARVVIDIASSRSVGRVARGGQPHLDEPRWRCVSVRGARGTTTAVRVIACDVGVAASARAMRWRGGVRAPRSGWFTLARVMHAAVGRCETRDARRLAARATRTTSVDAVRPKAAAAWHGTAASRRRACRRCCSRRRGGRRRVRLASAQAASVRGGERGTSTPRAASARARCSARRRARGCTPRRGARSCRSSAARGWARGVVRRCLQRYRGNAGGDRARRVRGDARRGRAARAANEAGGRYRGIALTSARACFQGRSGSRSARLDAASRSTRCPGGVEALCGRGCGG